MNELMSISKRFSMNLRQKTLLMMILIVILLAGIVIGGLVITDDDLQTNFSNKNAAPTADHLFGTDWLGRDMFLRTVEGLSVSMQIGLMASGFSVIIAMTLGLMAGALGGKVDEGISWLTDLCLGVPHMLVLILICVSVGGGVYGVILGVSLTHWPSLTRVIRGEVLSIRTSEYVTISRNFGKSPLNIAIQHFIPHLIPQLLVGALLIFPHAILHEASISFLGFGLSPHEPSTGIILSESVKYLMTGSWWLAFFPGLALVIMVLLFDVLGEQTRKLLDPNSAQL